MKLLIKILFAIVIIAQAIFPQQNKKDSTDFHPNLLNPFQLNLHEDDLYKLQDFGLYLSLHNKNNIPINKDPNTQWLWTNAVLSNSYQSFNEDGVDFKNMLAPQYEEFKENSKFNPIRYVLGMAQLSAVGYLAYKHIKKYGFK